MGDHGMIARYSNGEWLFPLEAQSYDFTSLSMASSSDSWAVSNHGIFRYSGVPEPAPTPTAIAAQSGVFLPAVMKGYNGGW